MVEFGQDLAELWPFACIGALQYFGSAGLGRWGEYWGLGCVKCCCIMYIISDIDVTSVIAIAMNIWSDRHAGIP